MQQRSVSMAPTTTIPSTPVTVPQPQSYSVSPYALYHPNSILNGLNINAVALAAVQQMVNARAIGLGGMQGSNGLSGQDLVAAAMRKNGLFATGMTKDARDLVVNMPAHGHGGLMVFPTKYTQL